MSQTDKCHTPPVRRVPLCHFMGGTYPVDGGNEPEKKKQRSPVNSAVSKNKSRRSSKRRITFQPLSESDTLRAELRSTHQTYAKSLCEKDQEIAELKKHLMVTSTLFAEDIDTYQKENDSLRDDLQITEGELTIFQKSEKEWIGRSLKLKFILDQIKKIEALPKDHAEWVDPMVDDIDMPEVSINVRDEFIPTTQTDNIDWVDSEDEEGEEDEYTQDELAYIREDVEGVEDVEDGEDVEGVEDGEDDEGMHTFDSCNNCGEINAHETCECPNPGGFVWRNAPWPPEHGTIMDIYVPQIETVIQADHNVSPGDHAATVIQTHYRGMMVRYRKQRKEQLDKELDEYMNSN